MSDGKITGFSRRQFVASTAAFATTVWSGEALALTNPAATDRQAASPTAARVLIDTDPGVDDAFALLLAMRSPELKIEGITAVAGNVPLELTLPNALRMVEIAGRTDIPVAAGAKSSIAAPTGDSGLCTWRERVGRRGVPRAHP